MDQLVQIIRKIAMVANFLLLGISGIFFIAAGIATINDDQGFNLIMGIVVLLVMVIIHYLINWIFKS